MFEGFKFGTPARPIHKGFHKGGSAEAPPPPPPPPPLCRGGRWPPPFADGYGRRSSIKQQASIRHHAASIKHQAASIQKLGSRLWQEIKKSCFFRLPVSYERISSRLRGVKSLLIRSSECPCGQFELRH